MNSSDIRPYIEHLSTATSKKEQLLLKSFLSGTYKKDYDYVMAVLNKWLIVKNISSETIVNAVECTKLFNEAMSLSQDLSEEQRQEAEKRRATIAQDFRNRCYNFIKDYGIEIKYTYR